LGAICAAILPLTIVQKHVFKNTFFQIETGSMHLLVRRSADFCEKRVFWGKKGQNPTQPKNLEMRIETSRGTPKTSTQCKNPPTGIPNFEWRVAAAGLKPLAAARPHMVRQGETWVLDLSGAGLSPSDLLDFFVVGD